MIYTGQTGWLQGGRFGFILDATPNDFVSGELEHAIVEVVAPPETDDAPLAGVALELELLERQFSHVLQQRYFIIRNQAIRLIRESFR